MSANAAGNAGHQCADFTQFAFQCVTEHQRPETHIARRLRHAGERHHWRGDEVKVGIVEFGRTFISGLSQVLCHRSRWIDAVPGDNVTCIGKRCCVPWAPMRSPLDRRPVHR